MMSCNSESANSATEMSAGFREPRSFSSKTGDAAVR